MPAQALLAFCRRCGVDDATILAAETPGAYTLTTTRPASALKALGRDDVTALQAALGDALTLRVGLPLLPLVEIDAGQVRGDLDRSLARVAATPDPTDMELTLAFDKDALLRRLQLEAVPAHTLYYLFAANLLKLLGSPLGRLDGLLFAAPDRPTLIVVADANLCLQGPLLTIVGLPGLAGIRASLVAPSPRLRARLEEMRALRVNSVRWQGIQLDHLTPLHLLCQKTAGAAGELAALLAGATLRLCLLYTANYTIADDAGLRATYAGADREVALICGPAGPEMACRETLTRLVAWLDSGKAAERVGIFQEVVARGLEGDEGKGNYATFVARLGRLLDDARWHQRTLVQEQIDKHFEQVQKLTDYVADVAKGIAEAIDKMTQGLSEAMLATFAYIVLTFLVPLLKKEIPVAVLALAARIYAVFLAVLVVYRLGSALHSYILLQTEARRRCAAVAKQLGQGRVDQAAAPLGARQGQFIAWYAVTLVFYVGLILLAWYLGGHAQELLTRLGVVS